jgi:hypothetical protein
MPRSHVLDPERSAQGVSRDSQPAEKTRSSRSEYVDGIEAPNHRSA